MNNKTKKIIAIVVPIVLILLIALAIVLIVVLPKNDDGDGNHTAEHPCVYTDVNDTQHRVTCSEPGCNYNRLADHEYANSQVATCKYCHHIKQIDFPGELKTPTGVKLTADKTELTPGGTVTLTIEISSTREDMNWDALSFTIGPINEEGKKPSTDLSPYFEVVSYTTNIDEYIGDDSNAKVYDNSEDFFGDGDGLEALTKLGFRIDLAFMDISIPTTKSIIITATLKIKESASAVSAFAFGIAALSGNAVAYTDESGKIIITDKFDQSTSTRNFNDNTSTKQKDVNCITCNTIIMSIKAKEN